MSISAHVRSYLRQHHIALVALFFALAGGTAYALDGSNTVFSDDIVNGEVKSPDVADGQIFSADLKDDSVTGTDVANNGSLRSAEVGELIGTDIDNGSLSGDDIGNGTLTGDDVSDGGLTGGDVSDGTITGADVDEASLSGVPRVFARADNSFPPGNPDRLELVTPGLGASIIVLCDDGGTPGADGDDTVSIGVNNLGSSNFELISERSAANAGGGVTSHEIDRFDLPPFSGTGSLPSARQTMTFLISPPGDTGTTLVAEVAGAVLEPFSGDDDNCSGMIQATQSG